MRLIYTPEGAEKQEFDFVPQKLMSPEAEAIESVGGSAWDSFDDFGVLFMKRNMRAKRAALWIMLKRQQPTLKFKDLEISVGSIEIDYDDDEKRLIREAIAADPDMDPDDRAMYLKQIDREMLDGDTPLDDPPETSESDDSTSPPPV